MKKSPYAPIFELTRGDTVECIHYGAVAVVNAGGKLIAWYGDPDAVTFLRSTAKPFQALPFIERQGHLTYGLTDREIALLCASHSGTDAHVQVVKAIQEKTGVSESDLMCGIHPLSHQPTIEAMRQRNEPLTPNRHNCSGKHTGMLAFVRLMMAQGGNEQTDQPYIDPEHPIQRIIRQTFAEMCALPEQEVRVGIDGCSAPNFAVPLRNAALAFARLCDPEAGGVEPLARQAACRTITAAMMSHPDMVAGPERLDTCLMETCRGRLVSKGGAEAFHGIGLMPGALGPESPALGIALKIADGDGRKKVVEAVVLEVLRQLGVLSAAELATLAAFGPTFPIYNWRKLEVGQAYPAFELEWAQ